MVLALVLDVLSLLGLLGAYAIHYFTLRRIGALRWVNHYTNRWQRDLHIETLRYLSAALVLLLTALVFRLYCSRRASLSPLRQAGVFLLLPPCAAYLICAFAISVKTYRACYFILLALLISVSAQILKDLLLLRAAGKNKAESKGKG